MPRILIAEGNTPALVASRQEAGLAPMADTYGAALAHFCPTVEIDIARPYFDDWDPGRVDFAAYDGMAVTGSGVSWSGADARARPFWALYEQAFASGTPALGCCWGLQTAAVVLGGDTHAGPNGIEAGIARGVELTDAGRTHPLHAGRTAQFDVLCMHRDDVTRPPAGAVITATNAHSRVQGMVVEQGSTRFWGVQYHPELTLDDIAFFFERSEGGFDALGRNVAEAAADLQTISADPGNSGALQGRYDIRAEILDFDRHGIELANWLASLSPDRA